MVSRSVFSRRRFVVGAAGAAVVAVTPTLLSPFTAGATAEEMFAVATPSLRLRSGPGLQFSTLATLSMGTTVRFLAGAGTVDGYDWAKVNVVSSGKIGFVAFNFLGSVPSDGFEIGQMVHVEAGGGVGNLRSGPGTGYSVIRRVASGTTGTIQDGPLEANGYFWHKVRFGDATGWIVMAVLVPGAGLDRAWVRANSGPLNVRNQPGLSGKILGHVSTGATGFVTTDMPQEASGYVWINVQFNGGLRGWVAKNFLTWL